MANRTPRFSPSQQHQRFSLTLAAFSGPLPFVFVSVQLSCRTVQELLTSGIEELQSTLASTRGSTSTRSNGAALNSEPVTALSANGFPIVRASPMGLCMGCAGSFWRTWNSVDSLPASRLLMAGNTHGYALANVAAEAVAKFEEIKLWRAHSRTPRLGTAAGEASNATKVGMPPFPQNTVRTVSSPTHKATRVHTSSSTSSFCTGQGRTWSTVAQSVQVQH